MGKPKDVQATKIGENYNWGEFGSANESGVNLSPMATSNIRTTQNGIGQYLNELINPSYSNESFRARQELLDASNRQYANQLAAEAIARGARGSATQNILNAIAANRNMDMRQAMTQEDARVQNILNALAGIEGNYFNQANIMGNNILERVMANQAAENAARDINTKKYNAWKDNLISGTASVAGSLIGAYFGGPMGAAVGGQAGRQAGNTINTFRGSTTSDGMYGASE